MDRYVDIRVRDMQDIPASQIMEALFAKLHDRLIAWRGAAIGVSFPEMNEKRQSLGQFLRLHGDAAGLDDFVSSGWLNGMADYVDVSASLPVPASAKHRRLERVQVKSNPERLRRRQMKRHNLTQAEAAQRIPDASGKTLALPYINVKSQSTGQRFRLFLRLGDLQSVPAPGDFNAYGLSNSATIPWFAPISPSQDNMFNPKQL